MVVIWRTIALVELLLCFMSFVASQILSCALSMIRGELENKIMFDFQDVALEGIDNDNVDRAQEYSCGSK